MNEAELEEGGIGRLLSRIVLGFGVLIVLGAGAVIGLERSGGVDALSSALDDPAPVPQLEDDEALAEVAPEEGRGGMLSGLLGAAPAEEAPEEPPAPQITTRRGGGAGNWVAARD